MSFSRTIVITENEEKAISKTNGTNRAVTVLVTAASNFGGGTLELGVRAENSASFEKIDDLIVGGQFTYTIGSDMEIAYTLAGSSGANITLMYSEG